MDKRTLVMFRVASLSKLYQTVTRIIMSNFKSIGQFLQSYPLRIDLQTDINRLKALLKIFSLFFFYSYIQCSVKELIFDRHKNILSKYFYFYLGIGFENTTKNF